MTLATDFMKKHGFSRGWAANTKRYYPDAFFFIGKRLYMHPDRVWYQSDDINQEYHGLFFRRMNDLYFKVAEHFNDYRIAKLLAIGSKVTKEAWVTYLVRLRFKKGWKATEFITRCELILELVDEVGGDFETISEMIKKPFK